MDRDFDGKLSFDELMGEETPLERLFHSMDKDGDGGVTQQVENIIYILSLGQKSKELVKYLLFKDEKKRYNSNWLLIKFDAFLTHLEPMILFQPGTSAGLNWIEIKTSSKVCNFYAILDGF